MSEGIMITQLNDHIFLMDENHEATGYLVTGRDKALVIDTMIGYENVREAVRKITALPLTVVNTHGHGDHIYGNVYFNEAYINEKDMPVAEEHMQIPQFVSECEKRGLKMPPFRFINDGEVIDLGGLTLDVIEVPCHTPGGICLHLREDRIMFTGDTVNRHLWLQLPESLTLDRCLENMDKLDSFIAKTDHILHGHARGFEDVSLAAKLKHGLAELVRQENMSVTENDEDYHWFGGISKQHVFDTDSVICYSPEKILS